MKSCKCGAALIITGKSHGVVQYACADDCQGEEEA